MGRNLTILVATVRFPIILYPGAVRGLNGRSKTNGEIAFIFRNIWSSQGAWLQNKTPMDEYAAYWGKDELWRFLLNGKQRGTMHQYLNEEHILEDMCLPLCSSVWLREESGWNFGALDYFRKKKHRRGNGLYLEENRKFKGKRNLSHKRELQSEKLGLINVSNS